MSDNECYFDPKEMLVVHASAVHIDGAAWIFLGRSGAGKSTICTLLNNCAQPLADDTILVAPRLGGGWMVADIRDYSLLVGATTENRTSPPTIMPLQAIFQLYQAAEPRLQRIGALETCRHLVEAAIEATSPTRLRQPEICKTIFVQMATIARSAPGYHLYFDLSAGIAETLKKEFGLVDKSISSCISEIASGAIAPSQ